MSKNVQKRHIVLLLGVVIMAAFIALNGPSQVAHASGHYEISVYVVSVESYETDNHAELSVRASLDGDTFLRYDGPQNQDKLEFYDFSLGATTEIGSYGLLKLKVWDLNPRFPLFSQRLIDINSNKDEWGVIFDVTTLFYTEDSVASCALDSVNEPGNLHIPGTWKYIAGSDTYQCEIGFKGSGGDGDDAYEGGIFYYIVLNYYP